MASVSLSLRTCSIRARVAHGGLGKSSRLSRGSMRCAMTACEVFCRGSGTDQSSQPTWPVGPVALVQGVVSSEVTELPGGSVIPIAARAEAAASIRAKRQNRNAVGVEPGPLQPGADAGGQQACPLAYRSHSAEARQLLLDTAMPSGTGPTIPQGTLCRHALGLRPRQPRHQTRRWPAPLIEVCLPVLGGPLVPFGASQGDDVRGGAEAAGADDVRGADEVAVGADGGGAGALGSGTEGGNSPCQTPAPVSLRCSAAAGYPRWRACAGAACRGRRAAARWPPRRPGLFHRAEPRCRQRGQRPGRWKALIPCPPPRLVRSRMERALLSELSGLSGALDFNGLAPTVGPTVGPPWLGLSETVARSGSAKSLPALDFGWPPTVPTVPTVAPLHLLAATGGYRAGDVDVPGPIIFAGKNDVDPDLAQAGRRSAQSSPQCLGGGWPGLGHGDAFAGHGGKGAQQIFGGPFHFDLLGHHRAHGVGDRVGVDHGLDRPVDVPVVGRHEGAGGPQRGLTGRRPQWRSRPCAAVSADASRAGA